MIPLQETSVSSIISVLPIKFYSIRSPTSAVTVIKRGTRPIRGIFLDDETRESEEQIIIEVIDKLYSDERGDYLIM